MNSTGISGIKLLMLLTLLLLSWAGCGGGGGGAPVVVTSPIVSAVSPANGATNIPTTAAVSVTFDKAMNSSTITAATFFVTAANGPQAGMQVTGTISSAGTTYTLTPSGSLTAGTVYRVTVTTGAMDAAGSAMSADFFSSFATAGPGPIPPMVSAVSPSYGSTDVLTTTTVSVTFNEAMNSSTITAATFFVAVASGPQAGTQVTGTITAVGNTYTFTPSGSLAVGTVYRVTATTGAKDIGGTAMAADFFSSFTTEGLGSASPIVSAVSPAYGSTDVPTTATVSVTFNEAMNSSTITVATFFVTAATGPQAGTQLTGTITAVGNTYTFTPSGSLAVGTVYRVTVTTSVRDSAGNAMAADFFSSFTT